MASLITTLALGLKPRPVRCCLHPPRTRTGRIRPSRPMYQYQLLDPETKLPNGKVWQTHKSPAEIKKGQSRMEVDYSALEMRVMAALPEKERERWMSGKARDLYRSSRMFMLDDAHQVDPDMLERLLQRDPHAEMAARIFEVPPGDVSKAQRQSAQAVGFAALYGRHQNAKGPF